MKILIAIIIVAIFAGGWGFGIQSEASRIQATCEADQGDTVIFGQHYLCLSQRQIEILRREKHEHQGNV